MLPACRPLVKARSNFEVYETLEISGNDANSFSHIDEKILWGKHFSDSADRDPHAPYDRRPQELEMSNIP